VINQESTRVDEDSLGSVEYRRVGKVANIVLNRPRKLNAVTNEMVEQLADAFYRLDEEPEAQIGILSGAGPAFCAGADVSKRLGSAAGRGAGRGRSSRVLIARYENYKPVIAAVHGYVLGLGLHLALHADLVVADTSATFQVTEVPRGIEATGLWLDMKHRGIGIAAEEFCLTGQRWSADDALRYGLVNRIAEPGQHLAVASELADAVLANPPLAVRALVRSRRWRLQQIEVEASMEMGLRGLQKTEDFKEAVAAFGEKRMPNFKGR
jgi:enoyl-CoA hydratase/carnithine racemase